MKKDFLLNLKEGDSVVVKYSKLYDAESQYITTKVIKVSKTKFTLEDNSFKQEFKVNGDALYTKESEFHIHSHALLEPSPESLALVENQLLVRKIKKESEVFSAKLKASVVNKDLSELSADKLKLLLNGLTVLSDMVSLQE